MPPLPDRRTAAWTLLTAAIAAAGAALFAGLGLPAAWLTGAMVATAAPALAGLPVGLPPGLRELAFLLLGISIGSSVTPESLAAMRTWPGSVALLVASIAATIRLRPLSPAGPRLGPHHRPLRRHARRLLRRRRPRRDQQRRPAAGHPRPDPARLHPRRADAAASRLSRRSGGIAAQRPRINTLVEARVVLAASGALALLLHRLGVPAGTMLGAMAASAALHASASCTAASRSPSSSSASSRPAPSSAPASAAPTLATIARTVPGAVVSILLALVVSAAFAAAGVWLLGLPFGQLWLA